MVAFELDVEALAKAARPARDYVDVPTFPAVSMDVAFVVDEGVTHEKLMQCMTSAGGKLLEDARLFDVYRDEERVGAGKKSMAYALTYRAADRTLTSDEVDKAHERLVKKVCGGNRRRGARLSASVVGCFAIIAVVRFGGDRVLELVLTRKGREWLARLRGAQRFRFRHSRGVLHPRPAEGSHGLPRRVRRHAPRASCSRHHGRSVAVGAGHHAGIVVRRRRRLGGRPPSCSASPPRPW